MADQDSNQDVNSTNGGASTKAGESTNLRQTETLKSKPLAMNNQSNPLNNSNKSDVKVNEKLKTGIKRRILV